MKKDWTYKKLGEVAEIEYGTRVVQKKDGGSIYPVYGGGGATFKMDTYNREDRLVVARFAMSPKCTRFVTGKFFLNDSGLTLKAGDCLLTPYLNWHVIYHNDNIYRLSKGAAQKNLDVKAFLNLPIHFPPISIQESIVRELDAIHGILEKKQEQLRELDNLAQSLFYQMFGDPITNPMGWEIKKLGEVTSKIGSGATPKGGNESYKDEGISLIRSLNVYNNFFTYKDLAHIDDVQANELKNVIVCANDILLNITGASVARCCIVPNDVLPARVNQHVAIIRLNDDISHVFMHRQLTSVEYQEKLLLISRGSGATREALTKGQLEQLTIPLPPLSLQQSFAAKVSAIEAQKQAITQSIHHTEALLAQRMDQYFA